VEFDFHSRFSYKLVLKFVTLCAVVIIYCRAWQHWTDYNCWEFWNRLLFPPAHIQWSSHQINYKISNHAA